LEEGSLVEGVIDLAFREGDVWTVVDFKTGREFKRSSERYIMQVSLYSEAVRVATRHNTTRTVANARTAVNIQR